jgi:hypothetical protein
MGAKLTTRLHMIERLYSATSDPKAAVPLSTIG